MDIHDNLTKIVALVTPRPGSENLTIHTLFATLNDGINDIRLQRFLYGGLDVLELIGVELQGAQYVGRAQVNRAVGREYGHGAKNSKYATKSE